MKKKYKYWANNLINITEIREYYGNEKELIKICRKLINEFDKFYSFGVAENEKGERATILTREFGNNSLKWEVME